MYAMHTMYPRTICMIIISINLLIIISLYIASQMDRSITAEVRVHADWLHTLRILLEFTAIFHFDKKISWNDFEVDDLYGLRLLGYIITLLHSQCGQWW
jgi:hypothetical protein